MLVPYSFSKADKENSSQIIFDLLAVVFIFCATDLVIMIIKSFKSLFHDVYFSFPVGMFESISTFLLYLTYF